MKRSPSELPLPVLRFSMTTLVVLSMGITAIASPTPKPAIAEEQSPHTLHSMPATPAAEMPSDPNASLTTPVSSATVMIEGFQFTPAEITLKAGGMVTFINRDSTPHTVTPDLAEAFISTGRLTKDESKNLVFDTPGVYSYHCEIHPSMMGKITVVE